VLALATASGVGLAAFFAYTLGAFGGASTDAFFNDYLYNVLELAAVTGCLLRVLLVRTDRVAWGLLTAAVTSWFMADMLFTFAYGNDPPYPSIADVFYLGFYPCCYVGLLLLVRAHVADFNRSLWLDGLTATLGSASLGAAVLVQVVLQSTEGPVWTVVTNIAYPIGDVLLLSLVVGVFALSGWHPGRMWLYVGVGFGCSAIADAAFLFQSAEGSYAPGTPFDALWPAALLLIAWSAWQAPRANAKAKEARPWLATPAVAALIAIGILAYDHSHHMNAFAATLALTTLMVVLVRLWLTFRENGRMLERIHRQAVTDPLTALGNRRSLVDDLNDAAAASDGVERMLLIFDLNGFKRYNDTFGHPAGDQLLRRLSMRLADAAAPHGTAYRLGGDEFCVLSIVSAAGPAPILDATAEALSEHGEGFSITTSLGVVFLPEEAGTGSDALRLADQRLYAHKHSLEVARSRPHEVLLQAISEREPSLLDHSRAVADLAVDVGRRLRLGERELEDLRVAAELHDVGKLAIPDAILEKPGPLSADEWAFVQRHTIVGERIVAASPALREVAGVIRASHERWDGKGYVDRLAGEEIPLASRIIFACDAFEAMTAERPYRARLSVEQALAVLRKNAGTQFDPGVVSVVCAAIADRGLLWDGAPREGAIDAVTAKTQGSPMVEELSA
jgi:diguanylate cyclase (GGDEF)-like protein